MLGFDPQKARGGIREESKQGGCRESAVEDGEEGFEEEEEEGEGFGGGGTRRGPFPHLLAENGAGACEYRAATPPPEGVGRGP